MAPPQLDPAPADTDHVAAHKTFDGRWIERHAKVSGVLRLECCVQFQVAAILRLHFTYQEGFMNNIGFSKLFTLLLLAGVCTLPELGMSQDVNLDPIFCNNVIAVTAYTIAYTTALQHN